MKNVFGDSTPKCQKEKFEVVLPILGRSKGSFGYWKIRKEKVGWSFWKEGGLNWIQNLVLVQRTWVWVGGSKFDHQSSYDKTSIWWDPVSWRSFAYQREQEETWLGELDDQSACDWLTDWLTAAAGCELTYYSITNKSRLARCAAAPLSAKAAW